MNRLVLAGVMIAFAVSLLIFSVKTNSQQRPAGKDVGRIQIIKGPALESATDDSAIITWTTKSGGVVIERSVVHYGTDRKNLNRRADSLNRSNQNLSFMIHRVYVINLMPQTTYYYTVESERGDHKPLGEPSKTVHQFTTQRHQ
jgi:hypothetical protein